MQQASNVQLKAIHLVLGPARILAGPGSGKTFTIIQRICHLIKEHHIPPEHILVITFTKMAALEMQQRYQKELKASVSNRVSFGTFHSICYHILKNSGKFHADSLLKETEKRKIAEQILSNHGYCKSCDYDTVSNLLDTISKMKNLTDLPDEVFLMFSREQMTVLFQDYEEMLEEQKKLDFDDMILQCFKLLSQNHQVCQYWQKQFRFILVDEFQDINEMQYEVVKLLALPENNLFVVGDDDQSIYGFRGTSPGIMGRFLEDFPDAEQLVLNENYRSGECIVSLANQVIERNRFRICKNLQAMKKEAQIKICFRETRREEEEAVVADLKQISTKSYSDCALIVRSNREVYQYSGLLKEAGIPVKGKKANEQNLFRHFIMEDIKAFLLFIYEGNKRSDFLKIMNKPNLFLTRKALLKETVTQWDFLNYYQNNVKMKEEIMQLFYHLKKASELTPWLAVRYFRKIMRYDLYLKEKAGNQPAYALLLETADNIQAVFRSMKKDQKIEAFLHEAEKNKAGIPSSKDGSCQIMEASGVSVMTMHSAKGLEFEYVLLPDINEGVIPGKNCKSEASIEEERRLLYVAITRARQSLFLYYTSERNRKLSRFLQGLIHPHPHP